MSSSKFNRSLLALAVIGCLGGVSSSALAGNNTSGSLKGNIEDAATESSLSGATVVIVNKDNGARKTIEVGSNGSFRIPSLAIGEYKITITKQGYETQVIESAKIVIGQEATLDVLMTSGDVERISVTGARLAIVDTSSPEMSLSISADEISRLPISQSIADVALLAPGTTKGDAAFGNLPSFGGASVAENTFIINGVNVTGFRRGTNIANIPFSAYEEFQIKTGGYSAEYGRSTGGVVNTVTKRGNNDWEFGIAARWEPNSLSEQSPSVRANVGNSKGTIHPGDMIWDNSGDTYESIEAELSVSGALIEDTLFVYGLVQPQDVKGQRNAANGNEYIVDSYNDPLWLARVDWQVSDDHSLMLWGFSDSENESSATHSVADDSLIKESIENRGGTTWSVKYDGMFGDWLSVDALYANVEFNSTKQSPNDATCPAVIDFRSGARQDLGCWDNFSANEERDSRKQAVVNFDIEYFEDHAIRLGVDYEDNYSFENSFASGHVYYMYDKAVAGETLKNSHVVANDTDFVRTRHYENGGEFTTKSTAFYIEDTWNVTDTITARIGLRSESFENQNAEGNAFIKIDNQLAPRLGLAWDVFDDGNSKVMVNWGRYHIPVASNTNVRMAGAELFTHEFNVLEGVDPTTGLPTIGAALGKKQVFGDGTVSDPAEVLDTSIKPMFQDEFILGYEHTFDDDWSGGVKYVHRDLKSIIDDVTIDKAVTANGWAETGHNVYVLTNPATDISVSYDTDGDGTLEKVTIPASQLGYPDPVRKYNALEFTLTRRWNDDWTMNASYTWAQSYGNAEGYVKSDNGQKDAGLTTDWDFPYLMDGAYGSLPNDRRHTIKVFGAYALTDNLSTGVSMLAQSGRPKSAFGSNLPEDYPDAYSYGETYYPYGGELCSRGCMGRENWRLKVDLNLTYRLNFIDGLDADLRLDVFNVFNSQNVLKSREIISVGGEYEPEYGLPETFETPRYVRLSANLKF